MRRLHPGSELARAVAALDRRGRRRTRLVLWVSVALAGAAMVPLLGRVPTAPVAASASCTGGTYTVQSGDGWYRIASILGVSVNSLLAANNATLTTMLHPGDVLCVPVTTSTTASTTTSAPTTTVPGSATIRQFPVQGACWYTDTWGAPRPNGRTHEGVDIIANTGKFVYAADHGTLTRQYRSGVDLLAGNGWRLTRADGTYFFYAHLDTFAAGLQVGSAVRAGQILGTVGMTGYAGAPHLHFEVHPGGGAAVNPTAIVRAVDGCGTSVVPAQPGTTTTTVAPATTAPATTAPATTTPATTTPATTVPTSLAPAATTDHRWRFIAPVRALDTSGARLAAGTVTRVRVDTLSGVGTGVTGVMLRVVAHNAERAGWVRVEACDTPTGTSHLSFTPLRMNAVTAISRVSGGVVCITNSAPTALRVHVIGRLAADGVGALAMPARRALDTRTTGRLAAGATRSVGISALGVPTGTSAVTVTVTLLQPASNGALGIGACGGTPWIVSYSGAARQTLSGVVRINDGGLCLATTTTAHVIVDVTGAWRGTSGVAAVTPQRLFDSRRTAALDATPRTVNVGVGAGLAQLSITAIGGTTPASIFVWNCSTGRPAATVVHTADGQNTTVNVLVDLTAGNLCLSADATVHVVVDLTARR